MKRQRDEGLGRCISTGSSATSLGYPTTAMLPSAGVKHHHDDILGTCVSNDGPNYTVPSTTYRCLPGSKMTLKTTVLGLTLPPKPVSAANTPSISQVVPEEAQSEPNDLKSSSEEERPRKRPRVSHCFIRCQCVVLTGISYQYDGDLIWLEHRDEFLQELLRLEGRGDYIDETCAICRKESGVYRCQSCMGKQLLCKGCVVQNHLFNPLHIIEVCR